MNDLLILTEAGDNIGFGHFTRCSAIQEFCMGAGMKVKMLLDLKGIYEIKPIDGEIGNWLLDKEKVVKLSSSFSSVLIDSYLAPSNYYEYLAENFKKIISIDDYNRISYKADVILNPNLAFYEMNYDNQKAKIVGGANYVILRSAFLSKITQKPAVKEKVEKVVITLGGGDIRGLLPVLTRLLSPLCNSITVVTGNMEQKKTLEEQFKGIKFAGYLSAEEMYQVFSDGDIVVSACGQTLHELASMGKTVIGICLDHDQEPNMNYYHKKGFLTDKIYWNEPSLDKKIISTFSKLEGYEIRKEKHLIADHLVNDQGLHNIYKTIIN